MTERIYRIYEVEENGETIYLGYVSTEEEAERLVEEYDEGVSPYESRYLTYSDRERTGSDYAYEA